MDITADHDSEEDLQAFREVEYFIDRFLNVVCDTSRRHILTYLSVVSEQASSPVERSAGEIAQYINLAPSTTSEHLKQLMRMHLLFTRREGKKVYYRLRNQELVQVFHDLILSLEAHYRHNLLPPLPGEKVLTEPAHPAQLTCSPPDADAGD
jgi:DNA-binding transcriptional ArsR family regulator